MIKRELIQTEVPGLFRDTQSGAIINKNISELNHYMAARDKAIEEQATKDKIESLENDISDIKQLLMQLVQGKNGNNNG